MWVGQAVSNFGSQFHMIAMPWLVLRLTGDPFAMGTVLASAAVPRALLMLIGGATTDRRRAKTIMLYSNLVRFVLVGALTWLVFAESVPLWSLYALALGFGVADSFFIPATQTIVPRIVPTEQLQKANSLVMGAAQVAMFAGPAAAGVLIALLSGTDEQTDWTGVGTAFAIDTATYLFAALTLLPVREPAPTPTDGGGGMASEIIAGLREARSNLVLRATVPLGAVFHFFGLGTIAVGIPVLAEARLPEGAAAFGIIMSAWGGGMIGGNLIAGLLPPPQSRHIARVMPALLVLTGLALAVIGVSTATWQAAVATAVNGLLIGYVDVAAITWLQRRTPPELLGRTMSMLMFVLFGIHPLAHSTAGAVLSWDIGALFYGAAACLIFFGVIAPLLPAMRALRREPDQKGGAA